MMQTAGVTKTGLESLPPVDAFLTKDRPTRPDWSLGDDRPVREEAPETFQARTKEQRGKTAGSAVSAAARADANWM